MLITSRWQTRWLFVAVAVAVLLFFASELAASSANKAPAALDTRTQLETTSGYQSWSEQAPAADSRASALPSALTNPMGELPGPIQETARQAAPSRDNVAAAQPLAPANLPAQVVSAGEPAEPVVNAPSQSAPAEPPPVALEPVNNPPPITGGGDNGGDGGNNGGGNGNGSGGNDGGGGNGGDDDHDDGGDGGGHDDDDDDDGGGGDHDDDDDGGGDDDDRNGEVGGGDDDDDDGGGGGDDDDDD